MEPVLKRLAPIPDFFGNGFLPKPSVPSVPTLLLGDGPVVLLVVVMVVVIVVSNMSIIIITVALQLHHHYYSSPGTTSINCQ